MRQPAAPPGHFPSEVNAPVGGLGSAPTKAFPGGNESDIRTLLDAVPQNVYLVSAEGTLLYLNRVALEYYGLPHEDFVSGAAFQKAVHPDDRERVQAARITGISAAKPFEYEARVRRHDGEYRWFLYRVNPVHDDQGCIVRWCASGADIHDRKLAELRLEQRVLELKLTIDAIPINIIVLDSAGAVIDVNQMVLDHTGLTAADVRSADFRERILHPEDWERVKEVRSQGLASGRPFQVELRSLGKNGQYSWFLMRYRPFRDEHGDIIRWYATGTNIDDRKRTEERVRKENTALREEIDRSSLFDEIVGSSEPIRRVLAQVTKVAPADSTVLILGESGVGKELIARAIHRRSARSKGAFIPVNCAAIPQSLIASELFGHEKGAFTGALERRIGRFESAEGGTIFLDEIGDLPGETQVLLLRVLQEREFERVGSAKRIRADVRIVAATNRDLEAAVASGGFRRDLYYRLNVFPIEVPSLRERPDDIPLLLEYFIHRFAQKTGKRIRSISNETIDLFRNYHWPGNIRELQNVVERGVLLCETEAFVVDEKWLKPEPRKVSAPVAALAPTLVEHERKLIENALAECSGRVSGPSGAAARLGMPRQTLDARIASLGINKYRFKS
jgi:formate hydrogenlyase transcriptional activator